jgi:hypothetical protein
VFVRCVLFVLFHSLSSDSFCLHFSLSPFFNLQFLFHSQEIVLSRLARQHKLEVTTGQAYVAYRETLDTEGETLQREFTYDRTVAGKRMFGRLTFEATGLYLANGMEIDSEEGREKRGGEKGVGPPECEYWIDKDARELMQADEVGNFIPIFFLFCSSLLTYSILCKILFFFISRLAQG